jgi:hydroxypyruvate isomerase
MHESRENRGEAHDAPSDNASGSIDRPNRRRVLATGGAMAAAIAAARTASAAPGETSPATGDATALPKIERGRIQQSVCSWCFKALGMEQLAKAAVAIGIKSIELVGTEHWPLLKRYGLVCAMTPSHGFSTGFADPAQHDVCLAKLRTAIDATADAGFPNVITFSGITTRISKAEGVKNAVVGLKKIVGHAEKRGVNVCIEMLNSRVNVEMKGHPGYLADSVDWVLDVCRQVGSPRLKLLFDIYHVQIMQGDVITRIGQCKEFTAHYHTAGNPGRQDLDDEQELNYPAIMKAIVATGYKGFVGQEFIPKREPAAALAAAARVCDV